MQRRIAKTFGLDCFHGRGHVVAAPFQLRRDSRMGETGLEKHGSARARGAQSDRKKVAQEFLSSSPRPNIASRSWAENCWKATIVWVRSMPSSLVR